MTALKTEAGLIGAAAAALMVLAGAAQAADTNQPISIATIDSSDADFVAHVYGGILERHGFNVEYLRLDYTAIMPALETGDLDVAPAIWDTTSWKAVTEAMRDRTITNYGSNGVAVEEGWWYPAYLEEVCPGLPDYTALQAPDCVAALATAETSPKGRYVDAPADWETESGTRMEAFGLDYEVVSSGSVVTMIASVRAAVERQEPIFSFGYVPHWYFDGTPGSFVKMPADEGACWDDPAQGPNPDKAGDCGFPVGFLWKMAQNDFAAKSPEAARLLHMFELDTASVAAATGKIENEGLSLEDAATAWIDANAAVWSTWALR